MKKIINLFFFFFLSLFTSAQQQVILGGEKDLQELFNGQGSVIFSSKHIALTSARDVRIIHVLTLEISPTLTPDLVRNFNITAHFSVEFGNDIGSLNHEERDLKVNYTLTNQYQSKDAFEKEGVDIVEYKLVSISVKDENGVDIPITPSNKGIAILKQSLRFDRYPEPNPQESIKKQEISQHINDGYVNLTWGSVGWASAYDIEYSYIDDYTSSAGSFIDPINTPYDFRFNSTRVQVKNNSYEIPLIFEAGYIIFRVRPVGFWGKSLDKIVTGEWSIPSDNGNSLIGESVGAEGHFFCVIDITNGIHEDDKMNWQYAAYFAEEGKRKDDITYFDGTFRKRQSVSNINTQKSLLVDEPVYDNLGREAIDILPFPIIPQNFPNAQHTPKIQYTPALNLNKAGKPYSWKDFDIDKGCLGFPDEISSVNGASKYYSSDNPFIDINSTGEKRQMAFVANADGYPFTQREYTPDNTGHIKRLSAPGAAFALPSKPGPSHEQKFFYCTPSQGELDRVFGDDVGFASHYSKEIRIDENGQAFVTYKNLTGNIVATAFAGISPKNLESLKEPMNKRRIKVNLIDEHNRVDENTNSILSTYSFTITENTTLDISYSLKQTGLPFTICNDSDKLCYDCVYDLSIKLSDDCGKGFYDVKQTIGTLTNLRECEGEGGQVKFDKVNSIQLNPGSYVVTKMLTVNDNAINTYINDYLSDSCWNRPPEPLKPVECIVRKCVIKDTSIGDACDSNSITGITRPFIRFLPKPQPTNSDCIPFVGKDICSISIQKMLADLSPGGQYAQFPSTENIFSTIYKYPLSILNENNQLPTRGNWKNPVYHYLNKNGEEIFIDKLVNGIPKKLRPEELTLEEFIQNWDPAMAYSLLPYHPEYCYYEWCAKHKNYFNYQDDIEGTVTFIEAQKKFSSLLTSPYLEPDIVKDPLFKEHPALVPQMRDYMKNISDLYPSLGLSAMKLPDMAAISSAGFSNELTLAEAQAYVKDYILFNDPTLADEEWKKFKFYYLQARTKIIEQLRKDEIIRDSRPSCCMLNDYIGNPNCANLPEKNLCDLFATKTPVFPTQERINSLIAVGSSLPLPLPGSDPNCLNCTQPQTYVLFVNTLLKENHLFTSGRITGPLLSMIATPITDKILSEKGHIDWIVTKASDRLDAKLLHEEDSTVICNISLVANDPKFDWKNIVYFSCLKSANGSFNLTAWQSNAVAFTLIGNSDCFVTKDCAPTTDFVTTCTNKEYTGLFVEMLEKVLKTTNAGIIPSEIINGRQPASPIYPSGADPVSVWHITSNTPISNNFDIPINFSVSSSQPKFTIAVRSTNNLFLNFEEWSVIKTELVSTPTQTEHCEEVNTIRVFVKRRDKPQIQDFFDVKFDFALGICCEFDKANAFCCMPTTSGLPSVSEPTCLSIQQIQQSNNQEIIIEQLKKHLVDSLRAEYISHCLRPVETFTLGYDERLYHYTLYYYDQAGNLIKTVPPKGVQLLSDEELNQSIAFRQTGKDFVQPSHTMETVQSYNSLNNVIQSNSPDGGQSRFCYDELGRLIYKQNAEQGFNSADRKASFIFYDKLGRIAQTGQIPVNQYQPQLVTHEAYEKFTKDLNRSNKLKEDVVTTFYDELPGKIDGGFDIKLNELNLKNLRNRVSATIYHRSFADNTPDNTPYVHAYFYSYDIEGNVDTLIQDFRQIETYGIKLNLCGTTMFHRLKKIAYNYDLISKKVNMVWYQPNEPDQFIHKYEYDADNRIITARTSTRIWDNDMDIDVAYQYYAHGPLARVELGQEKIQGVDYAYTIQGWLKGVNSGVLNSNIDIGKDDGTTFLPDVVGYGINYFEGDYSPIGGQSFLPDIRGTKLETETEFSKSLYNGNIQNVIIANNAFQDKIQATAYNYDILNRLTQSQIYHPLDPQSSTWKNGDFTNAYQTTYSYDANGNIASLKRNDEGGSLMDNLTYNYNSNNNQLDSLTDAVGRKKSSDLDSKSYYSYDASGRLLQESEVPVANNFLNYRWTSFNKPSNIEKNGYNIQIDYNATMQRAFKYDYKTKAATYYVRDLQGNILAVYQFDEKDASLEELPIYGASRVGNFDIHLDLTKQHDINELEFFRGNKQYELNDQVGNVLATVSDRRVLLNNIVSADIITAQDYYPFGFAMPGRDLHFGNYRFGVTGKEMDNELKGIGNSYDFGERMYDSRIGRWISIDPFYQKYPALSVYNYTLNNPLKLVDLDGNEPVEDNNHENNNNSNENNFSSNRNETNWSLGNFNYSASSPEWTPPKEEGLESPWFSPLDLIPVGTAAKGISSLGKGAFKLGQILMTDVAESVTVNSIENLSVKGGSVLLKPLGLGSTAEREAVNLAEELTLKEAISNPNAGQIIPKMKPLTDSRWLGWRKMQYEHIGLNGSKTIIHYNGKWEDNVLKAVDDFKLK